VTYERAIKEGAIKEGAIKEGKYEVEDLLSLQELKRANC